MFGLSSNQEAAVQAAEARVKMCKVALRNAEATLSTTPGSANLAATKARDACRRSLESAESALVAAKAKLL
jgi:hypothetical protein